VLSQGHGLVDVEAHSDHVRQDCVLLGAKDVVELRVDRGEVVGDLLHGLLHRELRHEPRGTGQNCRVGQLRDGILRELDDAAESAPALALAGLHHTGAETGLPVLPQPELLDQVCGLLGQLHPATREARDLWSCLCDLGAGPEDGSETGQSEVLRRQPLEGQEEIDGRRAPDDRQAIAVTDQLDLVVHRRLLKAWRGGAVG
jgi:hypothetical protein